MLEVLFIARPVHPYRLLRAFRDSYEPGFSAADYGDRPARDIPYASSVPALIPVHQCSRQAAPLLTPYLLQKQGEVPCTVALAVVSVPLGTIALTRYLRMTPVPGQYATPFHKPITLHEAQQQHPQLGLEEL